MASRKLVLILKSDFRGLALLDVSDVVLFGVGAVSVLNDVVCAEVQENRGLDAEALRDDITTSLLATNFVYR